MRFELYKILDSQYVDDFLGGSLFMNTLNYFRGIEENAAQGDPLEGICGSIPKAQLKQYGMYFEEDLVDAIQGNVSLISNYYGLNHLFCLYQLNIDDENKVVEYPSEELCNFNDGGVSDKVVVRIKDTQRFLDQIATAVDKGLQEHDFEYGIYGSVIYSNSWINADSPGTRSAFYKELAYSYQKEWRLCLLRNTLVDKPYKFYIGDLSDITEVISLKEFLMHPEKPYVGYSSTSKDFNVPNDRFRIFGTIDAVNHLMFSYMAPTTNIPTRTDQAQADWHYAKYLQLSGSPNEIDHYLDARMQEHKDLDHLELLVQYRLSVGEWVKATDAFMFFLKEGSCAISEDPVRFFFSLHTILMQHKEAADAGKLYIIATERYKLPDDIRQTMEGDILFALGFFDQSIPHFQKMRELGEKPILDYYLAVSYFHVLDFEKANQHLIQYEYYFSHSPEVAQKISKLRMLIDCFYNNKMLEIELQSHVFEELIWDSHLESMLKKTQKEKILLGIDSLYKVEKENKWHLIEKFKVIMVSPLTIAKITELYIQTGDHIFFRIIMHLETLDQVVICSPKLNYYLALDISDVDVPPYIKMERALHLQEMRSE